MADTRYIGKAALTYIRFQDGKVGYVERGQLVPITVDAKDLERLLGMGFLIPEPPKELVGAVAPNTTVMNADALAAAVADKPSRKA